MKTKTGLSVLTAIFLFLFSVAFLAVSVAATPGKADKESVLEAYGKLPLYFIENRGQMDDRVAYYIQSVDKTIYFTPEGITYALTGRAGGESSFSGETDAAGHWASVTPAVFRAGSEHKDDLRRWAVKLDFVDANPDARPTGMDLTPAVISYFKGPRNEWKTGLKTYASLVYKDLWPGIDLVYAGTANRLKYTFLVHPGADPSNIKLAYSGANKVRINSRGRLEISTPVAGFEDDKPYAFQNENGARLEVASRYVLTADDTSGTYEYGFELGKYDTNQPLLIDPCVLVYAGFIGGSDFDYGYGIAVDSSGNAYITGYTGSTEATFPETVGPDLTYNGGSDAFVAKVNADGTALVYAGYIGGSVGGGDFGLGIAVDSSGNAYITGYTGSTHATFPEIVGPDLTHNGLSDAFVAKVNADGTALVYAGYIGGSGGDYGRGIAVDSSGNAYITGYTQSAEATFPETVGPDLTHNGGNDAFVAKVNADGTALVYAGYIGGSDFDYGYGIAVDSSGNAYITGYTQSAEATFPEIVGPDLTHNGIRDAFVAKVNADGTALVYAGYIGGSDFDYGYGIAVDSSGNAYITGSTGSTEATFPETVGPDLTHNGGKDAFVAKVNADGTALVYAGYIGGSGGDYGRGIAVDSSGNAYITGDTQSAEATFPETVGPDLTHNGGNDAFVAKVNADGTALVYAGYIGGSGGDYGRGIAVDSSGNAYITGDTQSAEATFPETVGPDLTYNGGHYDAFVASISFSQASTVTTQAVTGIGATTATGNGKVTDLGVPNPTAHGVCWNTIGAPTTADSHTDEGTASSAGTFTSSMTGLSPNTTYYVRAYATNTVSTMYGDEVSFTTQTPPPPDSDNDGLPDSVEQGPDGDDPDYDGNGDGTPDWEQSNVTSFHTWSQVDGSHYITLEVPEGQRIEYPYSLRTFETPPPYGVNFPYGFFTFKISGVEEGGTTTMTIYLDGDPPQTYYKYGKTPDNPVDHWYEFSYNGETGAEVVGNTIVLHFVDGLRGDHDLKVNGEIKDPGGPAAIETSEVLYFPYLISTDEEETLIGIINTENYTVTSTISYYGKDGDLITSTNITLGSKAKTTISSDSIPSNTATAIISADGTLSGYTRYVNSQGQRCAWPANMQPQDSIPVPHTATDSNWATALCLFNPNDEDVEVTLDYDTGISGNFTLIAKSQDFFWLTETEPVSSISATGYIAAMEMFDSLTPGGDRAALLLRKRYLDSLYVPCISYGIEEFTGVGLINGYRDGTISVFGHNEMGEVEEISLGSILSQDRMAVLLSGILDDDNLWAEIYGEADFTTPFGTPLLHFQGLAVYGEDNTGKLGAVNLNALKFKEGFLGIISTDPEPFFALLNPDTVDALIAVTGYNSDGDVLASNTIQIEAGSNMTGVVSDLFEDISLTDVTHIRIVSDVNIYGSETIYTDDRMEMLPVLAVD